MNAHLKLSPNPFTIDAVQSGRYLHMHMSAHVCVLASRTTNCNRQPIPLSVVVVVLLPLLAFIFWAIAICLCLSGLRSTTTLTPQGVRATCLFWVFSFLQPIPDNADLPPNNNKASQAEEHSNRIVIIAKPAASLNRKPKLTYQVKQIGNDLCIYAI